MATHTLLFTGHMIDAADRIQPRFPPGKEDSVKEKIKAALLQQKKEHAAVQGIAGAACGGDILFQESCLELSIPSQIVLALPPEAFRETSVSFAGKNWSSRYDTLLQKLPVQVLAESGMNSRNRWEAANETMLQEALKAGGNNLTLIALWNGQGGDGPGGTQHLVQVVEARGAEVVIISI